MTKSGIAVNPSLSEVMHNAIQSQEHLAKFKEFIAHYTDEAEERFKQLQSAPDNYSSFVADKENYTIDEMKIRVVSKHIFAKALKEIVDLHEGPLDFKQLCEKYAVAKVPIMEEEFSAMAACITPNNGTEIDRSKIAIDALRHHELEYRQEIADGFFRQLAFETNKERSFLFAELLKGYREYKHFGVHFDIGGREVTVPMGEDETPKTIAKIVGGSESSSVESFLHNPLARVARDYLETHNKADSDLSKNYETETERLKMLYLAAAMMTEEKAFHDAFKQTFAMPHFANQNLEGEKKLKAIFNFEPQKFVDVVEKMFVGKLKHQQKEEFKSLLSKALTEASVKADIDIPKHYKSDFGRAA